MNEIDKDSTNKSEITTKTQTSIKWSLFAEITAKLMVPITNMILAHILAPEIFGIIASISVIIAFAEMFSDSGFSKFIIQHDFGSEDELQKSANVAFISNVAISVLIFSLIFVFKDFFSKLVGSPGFGNVLVIAAIQIPFYGIASIQTALLRRNFQFQKLFLIRLVAVVIPLIVSVSLALSGFSYWSIIISNLLSIFFQCIFLFFVSGLKTKLFFNFAMFKKMFSYGFWNMLESFLVWANASIDIIILGNAFTQDLVGIYKNVYMTEISIVSLLTSIFTPVLFSALSRLKNNEKEFSDLFFSSQKNVSFLLLPLGAGLFLFKDFITYIFFGSGWEQGAIVLGFMSLIDSIVFIFNNFASLVYFSKGKPHFSVITQIIYFSILLPVCIFASRDGFSTFVFARGSVRLILIICSAVFLPIFFRLRTKTTLKNLIKPAIATIFMSTIGFFLQSIDVPFWFNGVWIVCCIILYFGFCFVFFRKDTQKFFNFVFLFRKKK